MKDFLKSKVVTVVILLATLVLAGIAIFTAIRLYQLRQQAVAPNAPASKPQAAAPISCTALTFSLSTPTATPSGSPTPTPSVTPTSTPTETPTNTPTTTPTSTATGAPNTCGGTCGSNSNCSSDLVCYSGYCRNPNCTSDTDCVCPTTTATATTTPSLPTAGTSWPTILGIGTGAVLLIGALILAL